ncbi:MAG: ATP-dependent DNA ligase [Candidatus Anstonellales archaeon]
MQFRELCEFLELISKNRSRIYITDQLSKLYSNISSEEAMMVSYMLVGQIAPSYVSLELGVSSNLILQALSAVTGISKDDLELNLKKSGDIGDLAYNILNRKERIRSLINKELEIADVFNSLKRIALESSQKIKIEILINLLSRTSPIEAKYLTRFIVNKTRIAIGIMTVLDSIAKAKNVDKDHVRNIYYLISDIGKTALKIFRNDLSYRVELFTPISPALAERVKDAEEILSRSNPVFVEYKYDGFRAQIHKRGRDVKIFSRRLEDITKYIPEIVDDVRRIGDDFILEGEIVSFVDSKPLPFQEIIKRKRKHDVIEYSNRIPVEVYAFDILYLNGEELYNTTFIHRRNLLEAFINRSGFSRIKLSTGEMVDNSSRIEELFNRALSSGMEGLIAKKPDSIYTPGQRNHNWMKLKKSGDTIDCVVVGYFYGQGRLKDYPGSLLVCVYDEQLDEYQTVAKVSSGLSEDEFMLLKEKLISLDSPYLNINTRMQPDVWVEPNVILELAYDNITISPVHTCAYTEFNGKGLALRFPRVIRIRDDKGLGEITRSLEVVDLYRLQGGEIGEESEDKE